MIGPKLDARSYTNLILVVIALLLAINLVAQPPSTGRTLYTPEAEATQQVAAAVQQVAASNQQIAQALNRVADSIANAGNQVAASLRSSGGPSGSVAPSSSSGSYSSGSAPSSSSPSSAPSYEGSIKVLK